MKFITLSPVGNTLYFIANSLFMLEKKIKLEEDVPEKVEVDIFIDLEDEIKSKIETLMNLVILDVLCEDVEFKLIKKPIKKTRLKFEELSEEHETICLFSGGIDSTLGISKTKEKYGDVLGLFISHGDLGKITKKVYDLKKIILDPEEINLIKMIAPPMGRGYSQLRGFLYILYAMIVSCFCNTKRIIISECGSTMYQPKFAPMDTITYTTNPYVLSSAKKIGELILGREIEIVTPFEDFTKTEMMNLIKDDSILSKTHSCISGRWGINCGRCYACIARMIGSVNLGLSLDYFKFNTFEEENNMLSSFVNFCFDYLLFKENVDYWSLKNIEIFNKEDLFDRTCLDVFIALKKLSNQGYMDTEYSIVLEEFVKSNRDRLKSREEKLEIVKDPDFKNKVRKLHENI